MAGGGYGGFLRSGGNGDGGGTDQTLRNWNYQAASQSDRTGLPAIERFPSCRRIGGGDWRGWRRVCELVHSILAHLEVDGAVTSWSERTSERAWIGLGWVGLGWAWHTPYPHESNCICIPSACTTVASSYSFKDIWNAIQAV